jgi:hypothetical protein
VREEVAGPAFRSAPPSRGETHPGGRVIAGERLRPDGRNEGSGDDPVAEPSPGASPPPASATPVTGFKAA